MKKRNVKKLVSLGMCFVLAIVFSSELGAADLKNVPVKGMVTMVDLGAKSCIPCRMMAPILKKLEGRYAGKAAIIFLDVWKDPEPARRFGIRAIPTQIFFNKKGEEVYRHEGFMSEKEIISVLSQMGVD
ncbi:MAG: thioredoxin family protein [Syntrophales bacterium]